jgi:hypothetical protein
MRQPRRFGISVHLAVRVVGLVDGSPCPRALASALAKPLSGLGPQCAWGEILRYEGSGPE